MHSLRSIDRTEIAPAPMPNAELDLARGSGPPPDPSVVSAVAVLMGQVEARYPHQELDPVTTRMYMSEWIEMAARYGVNRLAASLRAVFRDRARPNFFPGPDEIEAHCLGAARADRERRDAAKAIEQQAAWKAAWELERAEDVANGIACGGEPKAELDARLRTPPPPRHSEAEIAAYQAAHVDPGRLAEIRETMARLRATATATATEIAT